MEAINIEATSDTPKIVLDASSGIFEIEQRCFPEDAKKFFNPIIEWIENYALSPNPGTNFNFKLEYYNTSSSKQLFKIFLILEELSKKKEVLVSWHYSNNDQDMLSSGERYSQMFELKFNLVEF